MLVRTIAVSVDKSFAFEDLDERLELYVSTRRNVRFLRSEIVPRLFVIACTHKRIAHHLESSHPRPRITRRLAGLERLTRTLRILTQRELDSRRRVRYQEILKRLSV